MRILSSIKDRPTADGPFLLSKVEDAFTISGRGVVTVPAFPKGGPEFPIQIGDIIELRRIDGASTKTHIRGMEHLRSKGGSQWGLLLPLEIIKTDVPVGTEIWWMASAPQKSPE